MTSLLHEKDLVFSNASINVASVARQVHRAATSQSISARLRSIDQDVQYVTQQAHEKQLPLVCNERCGSWYVPPALKAGSVYFKSTDGHFREWAFSLRRLNLQLLSVIGANDGCIIVDSTRRGKRTSDAPDALSKTIPIWCAVMNRLLFSDHAPGNHVTLHPLLVGESEREQIASRVSQFVATARSLGLDLQGLRSRLRKPMQPHWLVRSLPLNSADSATATSRTSHPVYLCMASDFHESSTDNGYIQGAGDDSESWAQGLSPELFWAHRDHLLDTLEIDLPNLIAQMCIGSEADVRSSSSTPTTIKSYPQVSIGRSDHLLPSEQDRLVILIDNDASKLDQYPMTTKGRCLHLQCAAGKLGSRDLRRELPKVARFLESLVKILPVFVACPTGKDLSVGVALAIICRYGTRDGTLDFSKRASDIGKAVVKQRLASIIQSVPTANPSRATLTAVNAFLMGEGR